MDDRHHFIFLIDQVPVRFYRGLADDPKARTLRRQKAEADQLGLALGVDAAEGLVFRLAIETGSTGGVEWVVLLALRGETGHAECAWPIPLALPAAPGKPGVQLRLIEDDAYEAQRRRRLSEARRRRHMAQRAGSGLSDRRLPRRFLPGLRRGMDSSLCIRRRFPWLSVRAANGWRPVPALPHRPTVTRVAVQRGRVV